MFDQPLRPFLLIAIATWHLGPLQAAEQPPSTITAPRAQVDAKPAPSVSPAVNKPQEAISQPIVVEQMTPAQEQWRKEFLASPRPKQEGCHVATFPDKTWRETACAPRPRKLYPPRLGGISRIDTVGGAGPDFAALVIGHITESEGSFDHATGITSECSVACPGQVCPTTPSCATSTNAYSLQLNTAPFTTSACSGSPVPANCLGWEQFVYEGSGGGFFIQYWLLRYGPAGTMCPMPRHAGCTSGYAYSDGWCPFQFSPTDDVYCVVNGSNQPPAPAVMASSLGQLKVRGSAAGVGGSTTDGIVVSVGSTTYSAAGGNYFPDLGTQWQQAEFNVFGDGNGSQAVFNSGATLQVRTEVISGTSDGPGCQVTSFTGESNNLTLANSAPFAAPGTMPALVFSSNTPAPAGAAATCADALSLGDTHLKTFSGLLYDFQATGDFLLAETSPAFRVETRQVSGKPTWPDATVNEAVAVQAGKHHVAVCLPGRISIDGTTAKFPKDGQIALSGGGVVARRENTVIVMGPTGDSMNATLNGRYIDVSVGMGSWPAKVRGLLANVNGNVKELAVRDGAKLQAPFSFGALYGHYAESWRVPAKESLLNICGDAKEVGIPTKPFHAIDLPTELAQRNRAVCLKYMEKQTALLDACVIDVAMLGPDAARVYAKLRAPVMVGDMVR